jgi:hypothetical protein
MFYSLPCLGDRHVTSDFVDLPAGNDDDYVSSTFDAVINQLEEKKKYTNSLLGSEVENGTYLYIVFL